MWHPCPGDRPPRAAATSVRGGAGSVVGSSALGGPSLIYSAFLLLKGEPVAVLTAMWTTSSWCTQLASARPSSARPRCCWRRWQPPCRPGPACSTSAVRASSSFGRSGHSPCRRLSTVASPQAITLVLMMLGGAVVGAAWAAIPAVSEMTTGANEAITSLLLNYVAGLVLTWLVLRTLEGPGVARTGLLPRSSTRSERSPDHVGRAGARRDPPRGRGRSSPCGGCSARPDVGLSSLRVLGGNPDAAHGRASAVGDLAVGAMLVSAERSQASPG